MSRYSDKFTSGRFITTVLISCTYCFIVGYAVTMYIESMRGFPERIEPMVSLIIGGFLGIAGTIIKSYFERSDRKGLQDEDNLNGNAGGAVSTGSDGAAG